MSPGEALINKVEQVAALAAKMPAGAQVVIAWQEAPLDLVFQIATQLDGCLQVERMEDGTHYHLARWECGSVVVAVRSVPVRPRFPQRSQLKLVTP